MDHISAKLAKLANPGPNQDYAIVAIFDAITGVSPLTSSQESALRQCLCLDSPHAVAIASSKLLHLLEQKKIDTNTAQSLLLVSLSVSEETNTYTPLAHALVTLLSLSITPQTAPPPIAQRRCSSHMLSRALASCPPCGRDLIESTCKLLLTASASSPDRVATTLHALRPFYTYICIDPDITARHSELPCLLFDSLSRLGCSLWSTPHHQMDILSFLSRLLSKLSISSSAVHVCTVMSVSSIADLALECSLNATGASTHIASKQDSDGALHDTAIQSNTTGALHRYNIILQDILYNILALCYQSLTCPASRFSIAQFVTAFSVLAFDAIDRFQCLMVDNASNNSRSSILSTPASPKNGQGIYSFLNKMAVDVCLLASLCDGEEAVAMLCLLCMLLSTAPPQHPDKGPVVATRASITQQSRRVDDGDAIARESRSRYGTISPSDRALMMVTLIPRLGYAHDAKHKLWLSRALAVIDSMATLPVSLHHRSGSGDDGSGGGVGDVAMRSSMALVSIVERIWNTRQVSSEKREEIASPVLNSNKKHDHDVTRDEMLKKDSMSRTDQVVDWLAGYTKQVTQLEEKDQSIVQRRAKTPDTPRGMAGIMDPLTLVYALLYHPSYAVQHAALDAIVAAVHAVPSYAFSTLPILLHKIQSVVGESSAVVQSSMLKDRKKKERLIVALFAALPCLGQSSDVTPFIIRSLHPLFSGTSPPSTQALALRMLCMLWVTTGRGFPQLRTLVLSFSPSNFAIKSAPPPPLPILLLQHAWAVTLLDVCTHDGDKAAEFIHSIYTCMTFPSADTPCNPLARLPSIQAIGLACIAVLCEQDLLDFFKAWKIVKKTYPSLPTKDAALAAQWLRLMSNGFLDAETYPEVAREIVRALWMAAHCYDYGCDDDFAKEQPPLKPNKEQPLSTTNTLSTGDESEQQPLKPNKEQPLSTTNTLSTGDESSKIRQQAYLSLSMFDPGMLERIDALPSLWEYAELLRLESGDPGCMKACVDLVSHILKYEHSIRRKMNITPVASALKHHVTDVDQAMPSERHPLYRLRLKTGFSGRSSTRTSTLLARLVSAVPRALLLVSHSQQQQQQFSSKPGDLDSTTVSNNTMNILKNIPLVCPTAVLFLWAPPPPPPTPPLTKTALQKSAQRAVTEYFLVFKELCQVYSTFSLSYNRYQPMQISIRDIDETIAGWSAFCRRWVGAYKEGFNTVARSTEEVCFMVWREYFIPLVQHKKYHNNEEQQQQQHADANASRSSCGVLLAALGLCFAFPHLSKNLIKDLRGVFHQYIVSDTAIHMHGIQYIGLGRMLNATRRLFGAACATEDMQVLLQLMLPYEKKEITTTAADVTHVSNSNRIIGIGLACKHMAEAAEGRELAEHALLVLLHRAASCIMAMTGIEDETTVVQQTTAHALHDEILSLIPTFNSSIDTAQQMQQVGHILPEIILAISHAMAAVASLSKNIVAILHDAARDILLATIRHRGAYAMASDVLMLECCACSLLVASTLALSTGNSNGTVMVRDDIRLLMALCRDIIENSSTASATSLTTTTTTNNNNKSTMGSSVIVAGGGRVLGSGMEALGLLVHGALQRGIDITCVARENSESITPESLLAVFTAATSVSSVLHGSTCIKDGIARGIELLLRGQTMNQYPSFILDQKTALKVLEILAFEDKDPRTRINAGHSLSMLCYSARKESKAPSTNTHAEHHATAPGADPLGDETESLLKGEVAAVQLQGIEKLPENGALRFLCETLVLGSWPRIGDMSFSEDKNRSDEMTLASDDDHLSNFHAGAVFRCLAMAPRLPSLDWSAVCRKYLTARNAFKDDCEVGRMQGACVDCIAQHASRHSNASLFVQQYRLHGVVHDTLLCRSGFLQLHPDAQCKVLQRVPQLITALPVYEACDVLSEMSTTLLENAPVHALSDHIVLYIEALAEIISPSSLTESPDGHLKQHAQHVVFTMLFPLIPDPPMSMPLRWPLSALKRKQFPSLIAISQDQNEDDFTVDQSASKAMVLPVINNDTERAWRAMLRCAMVSPSTAFDKLQESKCTCGSVWLQSALVANGYSDIQALHYVRNLAFDNQASESKNSTIATTFIFVGRALASRNTKASLQDKVQWTKEIISAAKMMKRARHSDGTEAPAAVLLALSCTVALSLSWWSGTCTESMALIDIDSVLLVLPQSLQVLAREGIFEVDMVLNVLGLMGGGKIMNLTKMKCCEALKTIPRYGSEVLVMETMED